MFSTYRSSFKEKQRFFFLAWGALVLPFPAASAGGFGAETTTREPFQGIVHIERTDWPDLPRPVRANIFLIDLDAPGLDFRLTEPDEPKSRTEAYTQPERTLDYLERVDAQIAINANFYDSGPDELLDPLFLAVSNGERYSMFDGAEPALNIDPDNNARIVTAGAPTPTYATSPSVDLHNAVGGNERIVHQGGNVANPGTGTNDPYYDPRARTVAGLTQDNRTLVIITVDEAGGSDGVTPPESADLLIEYDVWDGINFDGGGSTTLAMADPDPRLANVPSDSPPRSVATNLAIFAAEISDADGEELLSGVRSAAGATEAIVSWITVEPFRSFVEFGENAVDFDRVSIHPERTGEAHTARLPGLSPETTYYYRIVVTAGDEELRSEVRELVTAEDTGPTPTGSVPDWWTQHYLDETGFDPGVDINGNGFTLAEEYFLGISPVKGELGFEFEMKVNHGAVSFEIFPVYPDRVYTIRESAHLGEWSPAAGQEITREEETGKAEITVAPSGLPRNFYHLQIVRNDD